MDIRQLKYFLTIAEEGNISKAAEKLHLAQPPLSQQLKLLESELGVKLIERNTRKLEITDAGRKLQDRAKQLLELLDTTLKEVKDTNEGLQGTLSIGTVSSVGATMLPELICNLMKKYPNINLEIFDQDTNSILDLLSNRSIDIGIIRTPFNSDIFDSIALPNEPMVVAAPHAFWSEDEESIYLDALRNKPFIVQRRFEKMIIQCCHKLDFEPRIICKSNDVRTMLLWATTGIGVALLPKNCIYLTPNLNLQYKEINEPDLHVGTAIVWEKNRYLSSVARHFLEGFREYTKA
jgi:DNA-binding transcriptional LysR family regulator